MMTALLAAGLLPAFSAAGQTKPEKQDTACCCCCNHDALDQKPPRRMPASRLTDDLIKTLSLTDEQVSQWKEAEQNFRTKMEAARPDKEKAVRPAPKEMRGKMEPMMQEYDAAIRKILSEDQYKQYQDYREKNRPVKPMKRQRAW